MFRLNSLNPSTGPAGRERRVAGWVDGKLVIERIDAVLRSTDFPNMKFNQFLMSAALPLHGVPGMTSRTSGSTIWPWGTKRL